jgi:hypothetical protein
MPLGDPARRDSVALGDLVLDANAQVPVAEDKLVEAQRPPDPVMTLIVARIDVIAEVSAVDTNGGGRVLPEQTRSSASRARRVGSLAAIAERRLRIGDGLPAHRLAVSHGPNVRESRIHA